MSDRFVVDGVGREVGILDTQKNVFAPFYGDDPADVRRRLDYAVTRLNDKTDTVTGYTWNKVPQPGAEEGT